MPSESKSAKTAEAVMAQKVYDLAARTTDLRPIEPMDFDIKPNSIPDKPPTLLMVRPRELWVDGRYQRDVSRSGKRLIMNIISNFSWQKFRPPVVTRDEQDRYLVIDGQHTAIGAASHPGIDRIPVSFIQVDTLNEQALAFISLNTAMVRVPQIDLFFAKLTSGDERAITIMEILGKYGVHISRYLPSQGNFEPNHTIATGQLGKLLDKYGTERFDEMIRVAAQCNLRPIRAEHMKAIVHLMYESAPDEIKVDPDLLAQLIRNLNDVDSRVQAQRIAGSMNMSQGHALAVVYRNRYRELYKKVK